MMTYLPFTEHPPVSDYASEAAIIFKKFQFTCIGPFRHSRAYFEGMLPKKKYPAAQLWNSVLVRCYDLVSAHKIMSEA